MESKPPNLLLAIGLLITSANALASFGSGQSPIGAAPGAGISAASVQDPPAPQTATAPTAER
ncbi:MAG: hypothetical protein JXA21_16630 [Anaerolineae bacterium]|nr:hypothetical protein [Anaerolineae bacterium]